jgi:O-6-methylguanine DNA methyltransferase
MTLALTIERLSSPLGPLLAVTDADGRVRALDYGDYEPRLHRLFDQQYGRGVYTLTPGTIPLPLRTALDEYFTGRLSSLDRVEVASAGTPFQQTVWRALRDIPPATTLTYGALAARIGRPSASRAVGAANGSNPIAIIVPCHRVIGSQGRLTGYGGGLDRKRWLLDHERAHAGSMSQVFEGWALAPST